MMEPARKNIRGYMKLTVWQDAIEYYRLTCEAFAGFTPPLTRVAAQQIASVDSVHRNVAEGYCRRSIREYLQFLNFALASAGESVSALHAYRAAGQLTELSFGCLDELAYKIENGLKGCCAACAVPIGAFKAMQVAAGVALPKDVSLDIKAE